MGTAEMKKAAANISPYCTSNEVENCDIETAATLYEGEGAISNGHK